LWPFYLDSVISFILFFYPAFIVVYLLDIGLTPFRIGILMAVYAVSVILFEIPTGAFADLYGRKASVMLGYFFEIFVSLGIYFFKDYYSLMGLFIFWGFAYTFYSGASEAWRVDLINKKNKRLLNGFLMKRHSLVSAGLVISGFLGVFVVSNFGLSSIWLFGAASFAVSMIILLFAQEEFTRENLHIKDSFINIFRQVKESAKYSCSHPILIPLSIVIFIFTASMFFNEGLTWVPLLKNYNFPNYAFGYMWAFMGAIGIFAPIFTKKLLKENKEKNLLVFITFLYLLSLVSIIFVSGIISAFIVLFLTTFFLNAKMPLDTIYFHKFIPSKMRATIGSFESLISHFSSAIAPILVGFLVTGIGAKYTIFSGAFLIIPVLIIYYLIKE